MKTFVAVMNIPSPYRLHLLGEMARQLEARGIAFHCHFMAKGHADRPKSWLNPKIDFPHTYWRDYGIGQHHFNPGLVLKLLFHRPDGIYVGSPFDIPTSIALSFLCWPKVKTCGLEGNTKHPGVMVGLKGWFKRFVLSKYAYVSVPGRDGAAYIALHQSLTRRKMPKPVFLPNIIDETRFSPRSAEARLALKRELFGCDEATRVCLIPARLEPEKGLVPFLMNLSTVMLEGWRVVIIGEGSLKDSILGLVRQQGLNAYVKQVDYVQYAEMPLCYAAADLMLLPSVYDPNPLSIVEALHVGLPVAVSDQAGNVEEAVTEGRNGWVLSVLDQVAFAKKLEQVFATTLTRLQEMGRCSLRENARFWDSSESVKGFLDGVLGAES